MSFEDKVTAAQLGTAMMHSFSGQFLLPTPQTVTTAAASLTPRAPVEALLDDRCPMSSGRVSHELTDA